MEAIHAGIFSIVPPVLAIILALLTKDVVFSLLMGILSGTIIYTILAGLNPLVAPVEVLFNTSFANLDLYIIFFVFLLGALVQVISLSGGSAAYGRWGSRYLRSRRSTLLATAGLGCLIFVDDYFNCLTVGTVMKPLTDRQKISRAKLAYLIDSTAAPVCIIAPISSWAGAVGSSLRATGSFASDFSAFCATIPYNLYALLTLLMIVFLIFTGWDFGPMRKQEEMSAAIHGRKQIVWRCVNRIEYGTKFCGNSPSIPEEELHRAILKAIQGLAANFTDEVAAQINGILHNIQTDESTKPNLQEQLEQTQQEFDRLLEMSLDFDEDTPFLDDRLKKLNSKIKRLKKAIEDSAAQQEKASQPEMLLSAKVMQIQEYDDALTARIIEKITVRSRNEIEIRFIGGYKKTMQLT